MPECRVLLYSITDRTACASIVAHRRRALLAKIHEAAAAGIDYIQLRERDLSARELQALTAQAVELLRKFPGTRVLVNSRIDVALAAGAHGAHLRADDISPADARGIWRQARPQDKPVIAVSCHSSEELAAAEKSGADFAVLGPVFEKQNAGRAPLGIEGLRKILGARERMQPRAMPVLALGGVTPENASACLRAGVAGIAGIRLFQRGNIAGTVRALRQLASCTP